MIRLNLSESGQGNYRLYLCLKLWLRSYFRVKYHLNIGTLRKHLGL